MSGDSASADHQQDQTGWGQPISDERKAALDDLAKRQREWEEQPKETRGYSLFVGERLSGADLYWLAIRALAGFGDAPEALDDAARVLLTPAEGEVGEVGEGREGREAWEARRAGAAAAEREPAPTIDLAPLNVEGADLRGADLKHARLYSAHLEYVNLFAAYLAGADLRRAQLAHANLNRAHVEGAVLTGAQLTHAQLNEAHLEGSVLIAADLTGADLRAAQLAYTNLFMATLEGAQFDGIHLEGAHLFATHLEGADLFDAHLEGANLGEAHLERANLAGAHLEGANLVGAYLERAFLIGARLEGANLMAAYLPHAILRGARLQRADLTRADLTGVEFVAAHLEGADLSEANLEHADLSSSWLDSMTELNATVTSDSTKLGDIHWNGVGTVDLTRLPWEHILRLGDERDVEWRSPAKDLAAVVRAYRQLAAQLRAQGMADEADRFSYRAQVCQRGVLLRTWRLPQYAFSWLLAILAGYGYRPGRTLLWYLLVVLGYAFAYLHVGPSVGVPLSPLGALVFSVTSFHGRGFFPGGSPGHSITLDDPLTVLAASEAIIGLLIEISFIATFTQRYFGAK